MGSKESSFFVIFMSIVLLIGLGFFILKDFPLVKSAEGEENLSIIEMSINNGLNSLILNSNNTKKVECKALVENFGQGGDQQIQNIKAYFYDSENSFYNQSNDLNYHYSNLSCNLNNSFSKWQGYENTENNILVECGFSVEYFANPGSWNCYIYAENSRGENISSEENVNIREILAVSIPESIDYGDLNATEVSNEQVMDIENTGNVEIDLNLYAYAQNYSDGIAMNCSKGIKNISLEYERYNITKSNNGSMNLSEFQSKYKAVSSNEVLEEINLDYRKNDSVTEAINPLYWRLYVPEGVAGACQGNLGISAVRSE